MNSGKLAPSRANPNPRPSAAAAAMQKPLPSQVIVDKFRLLLKQRDDELRLSVDDEVPPPTTGEIVRMYELLLSELTFNSKNIITDLTIVAEEQILHGEGIADAICARIIEAPVDQKLPSLYLLDSIVKNVGEDYIRYFSVRLPEVFCEAYRQVHPSMHRSMCHLFETWSTVFPHSVLRRIEAQLQFTPRVTNEPSGLCASESPRPAHGIHVNPKYIRQFEGPNVNSNVNHPSSTPSGLKFYGQKAADGYDEYGSDRAEAVPSRVGSKLVNTSGNVGRLSYAGGASMPHPYPSASLARHSSPSGFVTEKPYSPELEEFAIDNSPVRLERVQPSPVPDFSFRKSIERDVPMSEWQRKPYHDSKRVRFEPSATFDLNSADQRERTRALINAYGNDRGQGMSNEPLHGEYLDINGKGGKMTHMSWQNTEEEEFDWEKMGSSSHVCSRNNNLLRPSIPPPGGFGPRPSYVPNGTPSDNNIRRSNISGINTGIISSTHAKDAVSSLHPCHGSVDEISGFHASNILGSSREDVSRLPRPMYDSSQLSIAKGGRDFPTPLSIGDLPLSASSRVGSEIDSSARGARLPSLPSAGIWSAVNVHRSFPPPMNPPLHMQAKYDSLNNGGTSLNYDEKIPVSLPMQQNCNAFESKELGSVRLPQFPYQQPNLNQPNQAQFTHSPSQVARHQPLPHPTASSASHLSVQPSNQLYNQQSSIAAGTVVPSMAPLLPLTVHNNVSSSFLVPGGSLPPVPPGPPPASSQMIPLPHNPIVSSQPPGSAFSGLISSLMCQGLISLTKESPMKDSVGIEFNADLLKVRHESAISALYSDLPRQCTTCGLRFKCQEEHSSHMDWHVTKNRMSKNRKQKPSRKWFVNASMWLSGAEALGTDAVPGFLPTENIVEKKDDEDFAVPADDEQKACALCGEPFDDFYSDETEEWMYKGAVYLSAPSGSTDMDRSQLGPIVHAKCRSESNVVRLEGSG